MSEKKIKVYIDIDGITKLMGYLYVDNIRGKELQSFEYDEKWLIDDNNRIFIDPDIELFSGRQWASEDKNYFSVFNDSSPDRWGRILLNRKESYKVKIEKRTAKTLMDSDYLLGVSDFARMGAIRFMLEGETDYSSKENDIPPINTLRELESASLSYENEEDIDKYRLILDPGSSLGGSRPKSNVVDTDGSLWIAKFPSKNDEYDVGKSEYHIYSLAKKCGLNVAESKLAKFSKLGSTFLVKRFDRNQNKRVHFESAMALLGKHDGDKTIVI